MKTLTPVSWSEFFTGEGCSSDTDGGQRASKWGIRLRVLGQSREEVKEGRGGPSPLFQGSSNARDSVPQLQSWRRTL